MTFEQRIEALQEILDDIQSTSSLNEKREIIDCIPPELKDDFDCIIECLNGKHIFGFKINTDTLIAAKWSSYPQIVFRTVREVVNYLKQPTQRNDLSLHNIGKHLCGILDYWDFFEPIVNKTLRLGIGASLLDKDDTAPMLAKKYDGLKSLPCDKEGYYITEKLDGNRCIAFYMDGKWNFVSRNGKTMHVNFDMSSLPTEIVFDGEVLSPEQVEMSKNISQLKFDKKFNISFNTTSGLVNRHTYEKGLIYNIFDIQINWPYSLRRKYLNELEIESKNVRILPSLAYIENITMLNNNILEWMHKVRDVGGEGVMINTASSKYEHKRTNSLIKVKPTYTMDMLVLDTYGGQGKYEGQCGGLTCQAVTIDGKVINCNVGTGLSDSQRLYWRHKETIVGKIVEVEYFSLSQDEISKGTNYYSLRFPRLKKVRTDKNTTSVY